MKTDCEIIRDLLPLYAEGMVSEKTRLLVEEHFGECSECRERYEAMRTPAPTVEYNEDSAKSFKKYIRRRKLRYGLKVSGITALCVLAAVVIRLAMTGVLTGVFLLGSFSAKVQVDSDAGNYSSYMGENAKEEYRSKWGMDETIFPESLQGLDVKEYKMVYYNPWDAQYLSYLTVEYDSEEYAAECERLREYGVSEYKGYYSVTGFSGGEPLAMNADDYQGFIYAINTPEKENSITYVELIFCNYCFDIEYKDYIPDEYLPEGFDAMPDNRYEKKMMSEGH